MTFKRGLAPPKGTACWWFVPLWSFPSHVTHAGPFLGVSHQQTWRGSRRWQPGRPGRGQSGFRHYAALGAAGAF